MTFAICACNSCSFCVIHNFLNSLKGKYFGEIRTTGRYIDKKIIKRLKYEFEVLLI